MVINNWKDLWLSIRPHMHQYYPQVTDYMFDLAEEAANSDLKVQCQNQVRVSLANERVTIYSDQAQFILTYPFSPKTYQTAWKAVDYATTKRIMEEEQKDADN